MSRKELFELLNSLKGGGHVWFDWRDHGGLLSSTHRCHKTDCSSTGPVPTKGSFTAEPRLLVRKVSDLSGRLDPFRAHLTLKYALRMGSNAVLQSAFKDSKTGKISNHGRLISGFGAGVLEALVIVTPFEVVKIRLQQQKGLSQELLKYKGPVHCARTIIREEGLLGLWAGAAPTVMRNGTNQAAMFTAKNAFDVLLWKKHEGDGKVLQPWQSMISGFIAGTAGPVCTGPFDVVKTRLMAQSREGGNLKYKGMIHAIRTIYAEEGLLALWKGLLPRLMRIPPGQAIMWAAADQIMGLYERRYLHNAPL
ncbi:hypothetical protein FEM48_ZijujUnG0125500 [Ziziphus jujuba var. spinosa]|uniref:Mitochondrial succinate-fumarate transporter 1-like n=1 Tax=Ziziphus jujuba var. spinosa TaxID=714518 RepID=A0A978U7R8_ZIZJJ|nr:hypothetical protein FEM48_ZijujUnG0125500 [Ziziphus jujuba var. spinosa]